MQWEWLFGETLKRTVSNFLVAFGAMALLSAAQILYEKQKIEPRSAHSPRLERLKEDLRRAEEKEKELTRMLDDAKATAIRRDCGNAGSSVRVIHRTPDRGVPQWCECDCNGDCRCY
jgi:hypothetical protein